MPTLSKQRKWELVRGTNLKSEDRFCLLTLFCFQGDGKAAFCRQSTIAEEMGVDPRSIRRSLKRLDEAGIVRRTWKNRTGVPMRCYSIDFSALESVQRESDGRTPASAPDGNGRTPVSAPPGHQRPLRSDTSVLQEHPRTSNEHPSCPIRKSDVSEWFNSFWESYSKKTGRKKAEAAFRRAVKADAKARKVTPKDAAEHITAIAGTYAKGFEAERQFQKHPTTWLNGEHWNDDPSTWRRTNTPDDWEAVRQKIRAIYQPEARNVADVKSALSAEQFTAAESVGLRQIADCHPADKQTAEAYMRARKDTAA